MTSSILLTGGTGTLGYLKFQLGAERAVADSGLPWTTLRAAQFHGLVLTMEQKMAKLPVIPVPGGLRFQPVDSREVAARLVELTLDKPAGLVPDLAGPKVYGMADLIRGYLRARGDVLAVVVRGVGARTHPDRDAVINSPAVSRHGGRAAFVMTGPAPGLRGRNPGRGMQRPREAGHTTFSATPAGSVTAAGAPAAGLTPSTPCPHGQGNPV